MYTDLPNPSLTRFVHIFNFLQKLVHRFMLKFAMWRSRILIPLLFVIVVLLLVHGKTEGGSQEEEIGYGKSKDEEEENALSSSPPSFACTEVVGVSITQDWFRADFKKMVGQNSWQLRAKEHAFVENWADVHSPLWSMAVESACAKYSSKPDRVLFTAVNWEFKTAKEWATALLATVKAVKERHHSVKRIELLTMLRGPKNKSCGDDKTVVDPIIDEAIQAVVKAHKDLVVAGPQFEAQRCDVFLKGGPHFTDKGKGIVAETMAAYYAHT